MNDSESDKQLSLFPQGRNSNLSLFSEELYSNPSKAITRLYLSPSLKTKQLFSATDSLKPEQALVSKNTYYSQLQALFPYFKEDNLTNSEKDELSTYKIDQNSMIIQNSILSLVTYINQLPSKESPQIIDLNETCKEYIQDLEKCNTKFKKCEAEKETMNATIAKLKAEIEQLTREKAALENELKGCPDKDTIRQLESQIASLQKQIKDKDDEIEKLKEKHALDIAKLEAEIERLKEQIESLQAANKSNGDLEAKLKELQDKCDTEKDAIKAEKDKLIAGLRRGIDNLKAKLKEAYDKIKALDIELERYKKQNMESSKELEILMSDKEKWERLAQRLRSEKDNLLRKHENELAEKTAEIAGQKEEIQKLQATIDELRKQLPLANGDRITKLTEQIRYKDNEIKRIKAKCADDVERIKKELNARISSLEKEIDRLKKENPTLKQQIADLLKERDVLGKTLEKLTNDLRELTEENKRLKEQIKELEKGLSSPDKMTRKECDTEIKKLQDQMKENLSRLQTECKDKVAELQAELDNLNQLKKDKEQLEQALTDMTKYADDGTKTDNPKVKEIIEAIEDRKSKLLAICNEKEKELRDNLLALQDANNTLQLTLGDKDKKIQKIQQSIDNLRPVIPPQDTQPTPDCKAAKFDMSKINYKTDCFNPRFGKTTLQLHPDQNPNCIDIASDKFKEFSNKCQPIKDAAAEKALQEAKAVRLATEQAAALKAQEEAARQAAALKAQEEAARQAAALKAQEEAAQRAQEEADRQAAALKAQEEADRQAAALKAQEEANRLAAQRAQEANIKTRDMTSEYNTLKEWESVKQYNSNLTKLFNIPIIIDFLANKSKITNVPENIDREISSYVKNKMYTTAYKVALKGNKQLGGGVVEEKKVKVFKSLGGFTYEYTDPQILIDYIHEMQINPSFKKENDFLEKWFKITLDDEKIVNLDTKIEEITQQSDVFLNRFISEDGAENDQARTALNFIKENHKDIYDELNDFYKNVIEPTIFIQNMSKELFSSKKYVIRRCDEDFGEISSYYDAVRAMSSDVDEIKSLIDQFMKLYEKTTVGLCESNKPEYLKNIKELRMQHLKIHALQTQTILQNNSSSSESLDTLSSELSSKIAEVSKLTQDNELHKSTIKQLEKQLVELNHSIVTQLNEKVSECDQRIANSPDKKEILQLKAQVQQLSTDKAKLEKSNQALQQTAKSSSPSDPSLRPSTPERRPSMARTSSQPISGQTSSQPISGQTSSQPISGQTSSKFPTGKPKDSNVKIASSGKEEAVIADKQVTNLQKVGLSLIVNDRPSLENIDDIEYNIVQLNGYIQDKFGRQKGGSPEKLTLETVNKMLQTLYRAKNVVNMILTYPVFLRFISLPKDEIMKVVNDNPKILEQILSFIFYDANIFIAAKSPYRNMLGNKFKKYDVMIKDETYVRNIYLQNTGNAYARLDTIIDLLIDCTIVIAASLGQQDTVSNENATVINVSYAICKEIVRVKEGIKSVIEFLVTKYSDIENRHNNNSKVITYLKIRCDNEGNLRYHLLQDVRNNVLYVGYNDTEKNLTEENFSTTRRGNYTNHYVYGPFTKIFTPKLSNSEIALQCEVIKNKLVSGESVFIFGYGASGAGKTSSLVYFNQGSGDEKQGILIHLINQLSQVNKVKLSVHELIYDSKNSKGVAVKRIDDQEFTRSGKSFIIGKLNSNVQNLENRYPEIIDPAYSFVPTSGVTDLGDFIQYMLDVDRAIRATTNNPNSSRSHVLIYMQLEGLKNSPYLIIGDFAGVENRFNCDDLNVLQSMDSQKRKVTDENPFYTQAVMKADMNMSCPIHNIQKGGECNKIESLTTDEKKYLKSIGLDEDTLLNGERDIVEVLESMDDTFKSINTFQKYFPKIQETIELVFSKLTPIAPYINTSHLPEDSFTALGLKPKSVPVGEGKKSKNFEDYSEGYAIIINKLMVEYNKLVPLVNAKKYVTDSNLVPVATNINTPTSYQNRNIVGDAGRRIWNNKEAITKFFRTGQELDKLYDYFQKPENVQKIVPMLFTVMNKLTCRKSRENNIKHICTCRTAEGVFINNSLSDLRVTVSNIIKERMKSLGVIKVVPPFTSKCLSVQCNPYSSSCFNDVDVRSGGAGLIMDTLKGKIGKQYDNINIGVFCVFNWSREVEGRLDVQKGGTAKRAYTPPVKRTPIPTYNNKFTKPASPPAAPVMTKPTVKYMINSAHPMPYIDLYDIRGEYIRLKDLEYNQYNKIANFVLDNYKNIDPNVTDINNIYTKLIPHFDTVEAIKKSLAENKYPDKRIQYENTLYGLYLLSQEAYWNMNNPENQVNTKILDNLKDNITRFIPKINASIIEEINKINGSTGIVTKLKEVIEQIENINAISPLGTLEFTDQIAKYGLTNQSCGFNTNSSLYYRKNIIPSSLNSSLALTLESIIK
jgi:chromosome segregation ATPase